MSFPLQEFFQRRFLFLLPFVALWLLPGVGLATHWSINPQYHYGWFVPVLALFTAYHRWQTRPAPGPGLHAGLVISALVALLLLPTWFFSQPNPDWSLVNWIFTGEAIVITLGSIAAVGGMAWLRHFFFPTVFILTAVPWPDYVEAPVIQGLMRAVAAVAVNLLDLMGIGALQHGNLIEVATGTVGVSEACSGIRSFHGSLMASLFLGELFRFNLTRRSLLVGVSIAMAFVLNVARASFLAWNAAMSGPAAVERWHDPAGFAILAFSIAAMVIMARWLDRGQPFETPSHQGVLLPKRLPTWFVAGLGIWIATTVGAAELWYHDPAPQPDNPWVLKLPQNSQTVTMPAAAIASYHCDWSDASTWTTEDGAEWLLYFFEWNFGPAYSRVAARMHNPDLCLPASGRQLRENRGVVDVTNNGVSIPFKAYTFEDGPRPLFVYRASWQVRSARGLQHGPLSGYAHVASFQSVLWRERELGQQVAELISTGYPDADHADRALRKLIPQLLLPHSQFQP